MRLDRRRHPDRKEATLAECLRRLGASPEYQPSPYVRVFLMHVMAWIPDINGRDAITICRALYDMGVEVGKLERQKWEEQGIEGRPFQMGLYPDSLRISRVGDKPTDFRPSYGYRWAQKRPGGVQLDKYVPGFAIGFNFALW